MKTPQQLSAEILQKISARKAKQKRIIRNVQRCAAVILITAVVLPISLHLHSTATLKNNAPSGGNMNGVMPETGTSMHPSNNGTSAGIVGGDSANEDTMKPTPPNFGASDTADEEAIAPGKPEYDEDTTENDAAMEEASESVEESTKEEVSENEEDSNPEDGSAEDISIE